MIGQPSGGSHPHPGFELGGALDVGAPSASLAGLADAVTRDGHLAELDDDELIGVLRAWRRLGSWCSAGELAAIAELARRRPAEWAPPARPGEFPTQLSEFVSDEVAAALSISSAKTPPQPRRPPHPQKTARPRTLVHPRTPAHLHIRTQPRPVADQPASQGSPAGST